MLLFQCHLEPLKSLYNRRKTKVDIQTDIICFGSSFEDYIITAMESRDSELRNVPPELIDIDIFGIDRRPETDIICNTILKPFVTQSGLFHEI